MIAHIRESDQAEQSLREHLKTVAALCKVSGQQLHLSVTAELIGLLHDMGKGTEVFKAYLRHAVHGGDKQVYHHNHAPTGAIYVYERWFLNHEDKKQKRTAQMISLCIYGHHTGLMDCIDKDYVNHYKKAMEQNKKSLCYEEAVAYFLKNIADAQQLDAMFVKACDEIERMLSGIGKPRSFYTGLLTRLLLSMLIDADRWDSACFEYGVSPITERTYPDWKRLCETYDTYAGTTFTGTDVLSAKRQEISDTCYEKALDRTGIYRLSVPTGGGKTFASLRYALRHAQANGQERVFYVIPFNTILDQNARDIRKALDDYEGILEHHSNVITEDESEFAQYKQLSERWDSDIILTSMVQFLNAMFRRENTNARRMYRLTNAVIIFDEIQALPRNCKVLFERAITFLTTCCHSTVLLCTATQLELQHLPETPIELMGEEKQIINLHRTLKRVEYIPQIEQQLTYEQAAQQLIPLIDEKASVLMIVNTKAAAWNIFEQTCQRLENDGYAMISIQDGLSDEEIQDMAQQAEDFEILCIHLSTLLCPAHRKEYIRWVQNWTKAGGRALCVSTALIEAGINVSFPVVVRSLAGLPSIVQAAGRCNRNMEQPSGQVYIWRLSEENLSRLPEIAQGKDISKEIIQCWLKHPDSDGSLSEPKWIKEYFRKEERYSEGQKNFPLKRGSGDTIVGLLSNNKFRANHQLPLCQSFQEAGTVFAVIPQLTKPVLVPYGAGKELIAQLNGAHTMTEEIGLMRKIQQYCVNVYEDTYRRLADEGALDAVGNSQIAALKPQYYHEQSGVTTTAQELEEIIL